MRVGNQTAELEVELGPDGSTVRAFQGGAGELTMRGTVLRFELTGRMDSAGGDPKRYRSALVAPVAVKIRLDCFGVLALARRAMTSKGKRSKAGPVSVSITGDPPTWGPREEIKEP